jgi:hypothetical protein
MPVPVTPQVVIPGAGTTSQQEHEAAPAPGSSPLDDGLESLRAISAETEEVRDDGP